MKKLVLLLTFTLITAVAVIAQGTIRGQVTDAGSGEPIMFGTVQVVELSKGVNTDMDGKYSFEDIDAGTYTLEFTYVGFSKLTITEVKVIDGCISCRTCETVCPAIFKVSPKSKVI